MNSTEKTLAQFLSENKIFISFVPVRAAQEKESKYKTWQLHFAGIVSVNGKEESFDYSAGYGCALSSEKIKTLTKNFHADRTILWKKGFEGIEPCKYVAEKIFKGVSASKFTDQKTVALFMQWLLRTWKPEPQDLLNNLKLDAQCGEYSFDDFCANLGYDEDSRKAEASWRACQESGRKLRNLLGPKAFAELLENTESL